MQVHTLCQCHYLMTAVVDALPLFSQRERGGEWYCEAGLRQQIGNLTMTQRWVEESEYHKDQRCNISNTCLSHTQPIN